LPHGPAPGPTRPIWLAPCRVLRRKNIAEAILLVRWLRPEAQLLVTGGPSSPNENFYLHALTAAADAHRWPVRFGIGSGPTGDELAAETSRWMTAAEAVICTSIQEGFGMVPFEAASSGIPVILRQIQGVSDAGQFGFRFPHAYREVRIDTSLLDWTQEVERQRRLFATWRKSLPAEWRRWVVEPSMNLNRRSVAFSRLTLSGQLEVLSHPSDVSWSRCVRLNPVLASWRVASGGGQLVPTPWPAAAHNRLDAQVSARRIARLLGQLDVPIGSGDPVVIQESLARFALHSRRLYPLLWSDGS
jgi:hypothetical protein